MTPAAQMTDQCTRRGRIATEIYVLLMLAVYPLYTGPGGYMLLHLNKYLLFLAATGLWLLFLGINGAAGLLRAGRLQAPTLPVLCMLSFAALAALSTALSEVSVFFSAVMGAYDNLLTYLLYAGVVIGVYRYGADQRRCLLAAVFSYTVCCAIALLQLAGRNPLQLFPESYTYFSPYVQETRPFLGTVGNIDLFSTLHCLALPLLAGTIFATKGKARFLLLIPIGMGAVCLAAARVSSGLLALCATAVVSAPTVIVWKLRSRGVRAGIGWAIAGTLLPIVLILSLLYWIPFGAGTLSELHQVLHGTMKDEFGSHRIQIWRETISVFRAHPMLGIGPDALASHLHINFERYSETLGTMLRTTVNNAHNTYLQILVSFGMLGAIPPAILMAETWYEILAKCSRSRAVHAMCFPLLCYLIQAFFNVGTCIVVPLFLILWGMILHEARSGFLRNSAK